MFPDAAPPTALTTLTDGETDDLVSDGLTLAGTPMEVRFFFRESSLATVQIVPIGLKGSQSADNLRLARAIADDLGRSYGAPFACGDRGLGDVALFECKWLAAPIVVRLWYLDVAGQAPTLRVIFRKADDPAFDF
jgi:hypothetical protein